MSKLIIVLVLLNSIQAQASFYEWTSWSACGAGCAGERSRVCGKSSRTTGKDSCSPPETFFSQNCDEENCGKEISTTQETTRGINNNADSTPQTISTTPGDAMDKRHCCGCKFSDKHGQFETQFPKDVMCTWKFEAAKDDLIMVTMERLSNFNWNQGSIFFASPEKMVSQFRGKEGGQEFENMAQKRFTSTGNLMNLTLYTSRYASPDDIEVRFSYATFRDPKKPKVIVDFEDDKKTNSANATGGGMNIPLVASIVACVVIIIIASVFIVYRKKKVNQNRRGNKSNNEDEKAGFFGGQNRRLTSPRKDRGSVQEKMIFQQQHQGQLMGADQKRDSPIDCGYLSGNEIFIPNQQPTYVTAFPATAAYMPGQQYINWPLPAGYTGQPHIANMATAMYPYKQSIEQINPTAVYYPKSGGEG